MLTMMRYLIIIAESILLSCIDQSISLQISLPNAYVDPGEQYLCHARKISNDKSLNIVGFEPNATDGLVHHMLLFACSEPGSTETVWSCSGMSSNFASSYVRSSVCGRGKTEIIYAWAHHASKLSLPRDVGFRVGGSTGLNYLILQVHFTGVVTEPDSSGISMSTTETPPTKSAGVLFMASQGVIRAKTKDTFDITCSPLDEGLILHPFAFRVHTHDRGVMVTGYRIRNSHWSLIGAKNPQYPQAFYPVFETDMTLEDGDVVAARCHMINSENHDIYVGPRAENEMCNFYVMYWVDGQKTLQKHTCSSGGPPTYYWKQDLKNAPE